MENIMVNRADLIEKQLSLKEATQVVFGDGRSTTLTPSRWVPALCERSRRVSLNGQWTVTRWPFDIDEGALTSSDYDDANGEVVGQPGKVFYYDPEEDPATIENWDRVNLTHINDDDGAVIRRQVPLPEAWQGKRVYLRFEGIYPAGRVYCNGKLLGEHLSGLTPVEWDVTDVVKAGAKATVAVRLLRKHKHVQMDMPRHAVEFAGLSQGAFFHATEQTQMADYHLITELDESLREGSVSGEVTLRNHAAQPAEGTLEFCLLDENSQVVTTGAVDCALEPKSEQILPIAMQATGVRLWNDEYPNLYRVYLRLMVEGMERQKFCYRTGFRRFELQGQRATLNGNAVKFRGVNHLTFHPQFGMYTPEPWLRQCLTLMKRANVNAIRTHFLGPKCLAHLCDELGLYLLQELPIDWGHPYVHDPECLGPAMLRIEGGIRRDRHSPSVVVWSIGNENLPRNMEEHDDFFNHLHLFDELAKTLDPTRPTMFPPPGPANKIKGIFETRVGDIADIHYSFKLIREFNETNILVNPKTWEAQMETCTRKEAIARGWSGVWFSSEYGIGNMIPDLLNAPYASIIADKLEDALSGKNTQQVFIDRLREEWGYMRDDSTCLGGAYFPWMCSGAGNPWGWVRWGEDADWGVVTGELLPKPAFWGLRVLFSPVQFPDRLPWKKGQTEIEFPVTNHYNSIDLSQCTLRTMMAGGPPYMGMMRNWKDIPIFMSAGGNHHHSHPDLEQQQSGDAAERLGHRLPLHPSRSDRFPTDHRGHSRGSREVGRNRRFHADGS